MRYHVYRPDRWQTCAYSQISALKNSEEPVGPGSPAIGRALSELVTFGSYRTLDLRRFGYDRVLNGQAIREANVV